MNFYYENTHFKIIYTILSLNMKMVHIHYLKLEKIKNYKEEDKNYPNFATQKELLVNI